MENQNRKPKSSLLILAILVILYVIAIAYFNYENWQASGGRQPAGEMIGNSLGLSIPLVVLFGGIYLLALAWQSHRRGERLPRRLAGWIHWTPRIAAIVIILFLMLFSFDVFENEAPLLEQLGGFLIHNLPALALLVILLLAWKRPAVGFWGFLAAGVALAALFTRSLSDLPNLLLFVLPVLVVAGLFYAEKWDAD